MMYIFWSFCVQHLASDFLKKLADNVTVSQSITFIFILIVVPMNMPNKFPILIMYLFHHSLLKP